MVWLGYRIASMVEALGERAGVRWVRLAAVLWTVILVFGLLTPVFPAIPGLSFLPWARGVEQPSWLDKVIHAVLFFVETRLLGGPGVFRRGRPAPGSALVTVLLLSGLTEALQAPIPARVADWGDFLANLVGIGAAVALRRSKTPPAVGGGDQTR